MMNIVEAKNLSKWYGEVIALNSLDLNIRSGITGVVGPNGAGKSTLFKLMVGLIKPNKGSISVRGRDPWTEHALMKEIGYLPDHDYLPEDMIGSDFLELTGGLRGLEGWVLQERIEKISHMVGMIPYLDRPIKGYSKGMKQRLKISCALIHDPDILVLDEPLAGTDPKVRKVIFGIIERLCKEGKDIIISSHVLYDIERLTDQVVLLHRGRSIASGTISEIRSLLDEFPHNIVIQSDNIREMAKDLIDNHWVKSIDFDTLYKDRLVVKVSEPDLFFDNITDLILEKGYEIRRLYSKDDDLESVFKYLVGDRSGF